MKALEAVKILTVVGLLGVTFGCAQKAKTPDVSFQCPETAAPARDVPRLLAETREALAAYAGGTQFQMLLVTDFQTKLALMELDYVCYLITNSPGYVEIEAAYMADSKAWDEKVEAFLAAPSEFEGGSFAPMDKSAGYCALVTERIAYLREKYLK